MSQPAALHAQKNHLQRPWAFWLLSFFQFAAIGVFFTYLNIFFRHAGLSGTQIGTINMLTAMVGVAASVLWGYISDRTGSARYLIAAGALGSLLINQLMPLAHTFWAFLALSVAGSLFNSAPNTLVDSTILAMLGDHREDYGRFRVGGSIGYIITGFAAGYIYDWAGLQWMFPAYGVVMLLFAGIALLLPRPKPAARDRSLDLDALVRSLPPVGSEPEFPKLLLKKPGIGALLHQPAWILFMVCVFLVWIATNASIMFLGVSLSALGANQGLIGFASTIGALTELPFMAFSGALLRRFGPQRLLLAGMALMTVRFFLLGLLQIPEWAIAINLLNGPAFAFFWNSSVTYANRMAPPGYSGTAQGMLNSTISLAGVVSALLTGWLFDQVGATRLFSVMGCFTLAALLIFTAGTAYLGRGKAVQPG